MAAPPRASRPRPSVAAFSRGCYRTGTNRISGGLHTSATVHAFSCCCESGAEARSLPFAGKLAIGATGAVMEALGFRHVALTVTHWDQSMPLWQVLFSFIGAVKIIAVVCPPNLPPDVPTL